MSNQRTESYKQIKTNINRLNQHICDELFDGFPGLSAYFKIAISNLKIIDHLVATKRKLLNYSEEDYLADLNAYNLCLESLADKLDVALEHMQYALAYILKDAQIYDPYANITIEDLIEQFNIIDESITYDRSTIDKEVKDFLLSQQCCYEQLKDPSRDYILSITFEDQDAFNAVFNK